MSSLFEQHERSLLAQIEEERCPDCLGRALRFCREDKVILGQLQVRPYARMCDSCGGTGIKGGSSHAV